MVINYQIIIQIVFEIFAMEWADYETKMIEEKRDFLYCIYEIQCSCKIVRQQGKLFVNTIKHVCSEMINGTKRMFCAN